MPFNPATVRSEMVDFWTAAFSSPAVNKFWYAIISPWTSGSAFALGVCAICILHGKCKEFVLANSRIIAPLRLIVALLTIFAGDTSGYDVAQRQPVKLTTMEALCDADESAPDGKIADGKRLGLSTIGLLDCDKFTPQAEASQDLFIFDIKMPYMLP